MLKTIITILIIFLDQKSKSYIYLNSLIDYEITPFLSFSLTINKGIGFGIFNCDNYYINIAVLIAKMIIVGCLIFYTYQKHKIQNIIGEILIIGGAISNIMDRLWYPGVVDFISLHHKNYYFPTFNIADCAISLGVFLLFLKIQNQDV